MGIAHQHEGQLTSVVKNKVLSNLQFKVRSDLLWVNMTSSGASNEVKRYRIVVLGDGGVGKSALTLQYVQHNFIDYHDPTIEDAYQQRTVIDTEPCLLDILDTAGQVEFTAMREEYMSLILKVRAQENVPLVLVANKVDLSSTGQRRVSPEEGEDLAEKFHCPFIETSAAHRSHVDEVFQTLVREIRKRQQAEENKDTESSRFKKLWNSIVKKTGIRKKNI